MKTTNWNFYLCNESRNKEYLEFTLSRVWSIDDETADNLDKQLFFTYTIEPTLLDTKPEGIIFTTDEFIRMLYEPEGMGEEIEYPKMTNEDSGDEIEIEEDILIYEIIEKMDDRTFEFDVEYSKVLSMQNIMAHMLYLQQYKSGEKIPKNFFMEYAGGGYSLFRMKYNERTRRLEFCMKNGKLEICDEDDLYYLAKHDPHKWYEFEKFDLIRGISRWLTWDIANTVLRSDVIVEYVSGEKKSFDMNDDGFEENMEKLAQEVGTIKKAYLKVWKKELGWLMEYAYGDTHYMFELPIDNDEFNKEYRMIPCMRAE